MTSIRRCKAFFLLTVLCGAVFGDVETHVVQAEFERCVVQMERVERSLKRLCDGLVGIRQALFGRGGNVVQEIEALENRLEYFRNRFERAQAQADKIRNDLKNLSGPVCPSCIESSVNLYCRNGETLQADIDGCLAKAEDLRIRMGLRSEKPPQDQAADFAHKRAAADSLYRVLSGSLDACANKAAAATLMEQAAVNSRRADSLHRAGKVATASQAIDIAHSLLEKAAKRCGNAR